MKISILGTGSWGTALGQVLADNGQNVILWGVDIDEVVDIHLYHQNSKYFPNVHLNNQLDASNNLEDIYDSDVIVLATPSFTIKELSQNISKKMEKKVIVVNVAKGFDPETHERLSVVIEKNFAKDKLKAIVNLIGPSHAEEVILRMETAVSAVSEDDEAAAVIQEIFSNDYFRVYRLNDVIGAEIGAAAKNVIALASGICSGINLGDNARAALMTRGLAEIRRFGLALGGKDETFLGLTGVGDLIVTCTSTHSRNFQAGYAIGKEDSAKMFWEDNVKTVEGVRACEIIYLEAKKRKISMPITEQIYEVLYNGTKPSEAVPKLMTRDLKPEF